MANLKDWIVQIFTKKSPVIDWVIVVQSKQTYGSYDMFITDTKNKTYDLSMGAILSGSVPVPKGKWRDVFDDISAGSTLKVKVRAIDLVESKTQAVPILSLTQLYRGH